LSNAKYQRIFFDNFAKSRKFDPLDTEKWYLITRKEIWDAVSFGLNFYSLTKLIHLVTKKGRGVLNYYNGSHISALIKLYPELGLNRGHFFQSKGELALVIGVSFTDFHCQV
jgi:hypothetical protein